MKYLKFIENYKSISQNIEDKRIWRNTFEYGNESYRLESWVYIYRLLDGYPIFATVNKENANGVSGTGVAGVIVELDKIKWLDKISPFSDDFIKEKEKTKENKIQVEKGIYEFLKQLPPNMNNEEYDEFSIIYAVGEQEDIDNYIKNIQFKRIIKKYNI
jgi:hypothetical protein